MASKQQSPTIRLYCESCGEETDHNKQLQLQKEGNHTADFDRQPHIVAICQECGLKRQKRVAEHANWEVDRQTST